MASFNILSVFFKIYLLKKEHKKSNLPLEESILIVNDYTEEDTKIMGSIYADNKTGKLASEIAEEVGCLVQKVAVFARKMESKRIILGIGEQGGRSITV